MKITDEMNDRKKSAWKVSCVDKPLSLSYSDDLSQVYLTSYSVNAGLVSAANVGFHTKNSPVFNKNKKKLRID